MTYLLDIEKTDLVLLFSISIIMSLFMWTSFHKTSEASIAKTMKQIEVEKFLEHLEAQVVMALVALHVGKLRPALLGVLRQQAHPFRQRGALSHRPRAHSLVAGFAARMMRRLRDT